MNERMNEPVGQSECGFKRMNEASKRQSSGGDNFDELNKTLDSRSSTGSRRGRGRDRGRGAGRGRGSGSSSSIRGEKPQGKGIPPNASRVRAMNEIMTLN